MFRSLAAQFRRADTAEKLHHAKGLGGLWATIAIEKGLIQSPIEGIKLLESEPHYAPDELARCYVLRWDQLVNAWAGDGIGNMLLLNPNAMNFTTVANTADGIVQVGTYGDTETQAANNARVADWLAESISKRFFGLGEEILFRLNEERRTFGEVWFLIREFEALRQSVFGEHGWPAWQRSKPQKGHKKWPGCDVRFTEESLELRTGDPALDDYRVARVWQTRS